MTEEGLEFRLRGASEFPVEGASGVRSFEFTTGELGFERGDGGYGVGVRGVQTTIRGNESTSLCRATRVVYVEPGRVFAEIHRRAGREMDNKSRGGLGVQGDTAKATDVAKSEDVSDGIGIIPHGEGLSKAVIDAAVCRGLDTAVGLEVERRTLGSDVTKCRSVMEDAHGALAVEEEGVGAEDGGW